MLSLNTMPPSVQKYLDDHAVQYERIPHPRDYCAQETAADTHTRGRNFAKCVLVRIDNGDAMVVLPADHRIDFDLLRRALNARTAALSHEDTMQRLFPDCETGAEPPFGKLYNLPVYLAKDLAASLMLTFNAGSHDEAVRMPMDEFKRLNDPLIIACSEQVCDQQ